MGQAVRLNVQAPVSAPDDPVAVSKTLVAGLADNDVYVPDTGIIKGAGCRIDDGDAHGHASRARQDSVALPEYDAERLGPILGDAFDRRFRRRFRIFAVAEAVNNAKHDFSVKFPIGARVPAFPGVVERSFCEPDMAIR